MKRTAIDCLRRAALSTRANAGLILLSLAQSFLFSVLFVVSLLPPVVVLGGTALLRGARSVGALEDWLSGLAPLLEANLVPLGLSLVASLLLGLLSVVVWGWFQGGMLGVLVAAERQAPTGAENRAGAWRWFRTFSLGDFSGWGGRYLWRYFWFFHLTVTVFLLLILVAALVVLAVSLGYRTWGTSAAYGIGCGASLPLLFALLVYALWTIAAQPAVALPDGGTAAGARFGLRLIGKRPGAVLLIFLTFFVSSLVVSLALSVAQMASGLVLPSDAAVWVFGAYAVFYLVQWLVSSLLTVYANAAFASLVVAEAAESPR